MNTGRCLATNAAVDVAVIFGVPHRRLQLGLLGQGIGQ